MSEIERCREILLILEENIRVWGAHIDEFVDSFLKSEEQERQLLMKATSAKIKYSFMCQMFEHVRRSFSKASLEDKHRILKYSFVLLIFENFEFDYRENILLLNSFFDTTASSRKLMLKEWSNVSKLASEKTISYLSTIKGSPTSNISFM